MKAFLAAFRVEFTKLVRSSVWWVTLLFFLFVTALRLGEGDATAYLNNVTFLFASVLGIMGFGFIVSWVFGREYVDRTAKDLLAIPVSRSVIVLAKYAVAVIACEIITYLSFGFALVLGRLSGASGLTGEVAWHYFMLLIIIMVMHLLLTAPLALLAGLSRGYLLPIGVAFTALMLALTLGGTPIGAYLPWSIPALNQSQAASVLLPLDWISYAIVLGLGFGGTAGTLFWWRYADQK